MSLRWLSLWCLVATPTFAMETTHTEDHHQQEFPWSERSVLRLLSLRILLQIQRSTVYIANHCAGVTSTTDYLDEMMLLGQPSSRHAVARKKWAMNQKIVIVRLELDSAFLERIWPQVQGVRQPFPNWLWTKTQTLNVLKPSPTQLPHSRLGRVPTSTGLASAFCRPRCSRGRCPPLYY